MDRNFNRRGPEFMWTLGCREYRPTDSRSDRYSIRRQKKALARMNRRLAIKHIADQLG